MHWGQNPIACLRRRPIGGLLPCDDDAVLDPNAPIGVVPGTSQPKAQ